MLNSDGLVVMGMHMHMHGHLQWLVRGRGRMDYTTRVLELLCTDEVIRFL